MDSAAVIAELVRSRLAEHVKVFIDQDEHSWCVHVDVGSLKGGTNLSKNDSFGNIRDDVYKFVDGLVASFAKRGASLIGRS